MKKFKKMSKGMGALLALVIIGAVITGAVLISYYASIEANTDATQDLKEPKEPLTPTELKVKSIILERLKANDGKSFFNDFAVVVSQRLNVPLPNAKELVESMLPKIPTVQSAGDDWYQLS